MTGSVVLYVASIGMSVWSRRVCQYPPDEKRTRHLIQYFKCCQICFVTTCNVFEYWNLDDLSWPGCISKSCTGFVGRLLLLGDCLNVFFKVGQLNNVNMCYLNTKQECLLHIVGSAHHGRTFMRRLMKLGTIFHVQKDVLYYWFWRGAYQLWKFGCKERILPLCRYLLARDGAFTNPLLIAFVHYPCNFKC